MANTLLFYHDKRHTMMSSWRRYEGSYKLYTLLYIIVYMASFRPFAQMYTNVNLSYKWLKT